MVGEHGFTLGIQAALGVEMRFNRADAQVFADVHALNTGLRIADFQLFVYVKINADRQALAAGIEAKGADPVFRQHGDFAAGVIGGALALENLFFDVAAGRDGQRGGGDMDTDAFVAIRQVLHR